MKPNTDRRASRSLNAIASSAGLCALGISAIVALTLAGCATTQPAGTPERLAFPSPVDGPGAPDLGKQASKRIDKGWRALTRGDTAGARASAVEAGASEASRLLDLQARIIGGGPVPIAALAELTAEFPGYAAGWLTLSAAAEAGEDEATALEAAARGAELWPAKRWRERVRELRQRWIGDRLGSAARLLESERPAAAVDALQPVLAIEPDNRDALLLEARSFVALGEADRAEAALSGLPRDREVVLLAGDIAVARGDRRAAIRIYASLPDDPEALLKAIDLAEADGDWQTAMSLYSGLPDERPEKASGLRVAKLRWRISVMPPHVRESFEADTLDRSGLAVVLVSLVPRVASLPGGRVPLLSDIVDMPSQREIITAARLGLLGTDPLEHRFYPQRAVTAGEVRTAVTKLGLLLGVAPPSWCDGAEDECVHIEEPISGRQVADIVINMMDEEIG